MTSAPEQSAEAFPSRLLRWFDQHGRHDLPWQSPRDAYRVWVSEIMLQQTQVTTVIPYFERFMRRFPNVEALASSTQDEVLSHWAGLGYYARGRNLHRAAQILREAQGGEFPRSIDALVELPGIGRSTAGAIVSQAFGEPQAVLDGNVRRVIARHRMIEQWPGDPKVQDRLWQIAESWLPQERAADYTQAIMDLGSLVCTRQKPDCGQCPVSADCEARIQQRCDEFPRPRPRRERPVRQRNIVIARDHAERILVQRRPSAGIWGGLWCLPMSEDGENIEALCQRLGLQLQGAATAAPIRHALTHFELQMLPFNAKLSSSDDLLRETPGEYWLTLANQSAWPAFPTPIRALLEQMRQHEGDLTETTEST